MYRREKKTWEETRVLYIKGEMNVVVTLAFEWKLSLFMKRRDKIGRSEHEFSNAVKNDAN